MFVKVLQIHKKDSYEYQFIQDKFALNLSDKVFALADGTTQSFNSEQWAEVISKRFIESPSFKEDDLLNLFKEEAKALKIQEFKYSSHPAKASLEREKRKKGSTSTFIGIKVLHSDSVEIISIGDSNFFLLKNQKILKSFPFTNISEINANNDFLNTELLLKDEIETTNFKTSTIPIEKADSIIIATDALSRFLLKFPDKAEYLYKISNFEEFLKFIEDNWKKTNLEVDDISAIILDLNKKKSSIFISPPETFSFPKEEEKEFIPSSFTNNPEILKLSDMQMSEIRKQFYGVAQDFNFVKKKLYLQKILLISTLLLLCLNIGLFYTFYHNRKMEQKSESQEQIKALESRILKSNLTKTKNEKVEPKKLDKKIDSAKDKK